jgi:Zonular occludens toxin (Zot)
VKVGGGLNYVVGPMGSGKSLYGVRRIVEAVTSGRYVVTNVELHDDAFERIARHIGRTRTRRYRRELSQRLGSYYVFENDLEVAMRYRLEGKGEARGLFVWDETHNDLNNRDWRKDGRDEVLKWATQLRKLGYVGYLLSQHADNTDAALRRVCNFAIRLQNQREQTRMLGVRVTPWPLFLACWFPTNAPLVKQTRAIKVERYFLDWHRNLYDTHGVFHGLAGADDAGTVLLPIGGRKRDPQASPRPTAAPAPSDQASSVDPRKDKSRPERRPLKRQREVTPNAAALSRAP